MISWRNSIRYNFIIAMLLVTSGALVIGMLSIGINYYNTTKKSFVADVQSQASLFAKSAIIPVSLGDKKRLKDILNSVNFSDSFGSAIFDSTGKILVLRDENNSSFYISETDFKSSHYVEWGGERLYLSQPIIADDSEFLGSIYFNISTDKFHSKIIQFSIVCLIIIGLLTVCVYGISLRLQKLISGPIEKLDNLSRNISQNGNYALRMPYSGKNEIGSLAESFNQMLETIEKNQKERDAANDALQLNKRRLERAVKDLQYLANYDSLTQLPNRALCMDRIKHSLKRATRTNTMVGILFLDLDHFKDVNDSLGHAVGDQLLKATSQRLLEKIRNEDTLARLGGDEFVIILNEIQETQDVISIVDKIVAAFETPFKLSNYEVNCTVSIGVCLFPQDGVDVDSLMKAADAAMYKAKEVGRNTFEFYEVELNKMAIRRHQLTNELRQAVNNGELSLVFQPQLHIATNSVSGAEVLLRWNHPILGSISPEEFIPIAENTGLIKEIGHWVMVNAIKKIAELKALGQEMRLAINLSALQFRQIDLPETIAETLQKYQVAPNLLEVEITEGMLMRDVNQSIDILERLKAMQIRVAVDDFGTGYSSLSYLRRFPLDALKIDRSFIEHLVEDADDTAITLAVISMAKSLRLEVIAEGVEKKQQKAYLIDNNCDHIQGYYFAKPLVFDDLVDFLQIEKTQSKAAIHPNRK